MEITKINEFVKKYNLSGLIESVKWESDGSNLKTSFISDDKTMLGTVVTPKFIFESGEYGIYDTSKLKKMLSVLGDDVDLSVNKHDGKATALNIEDNTSSITYMLADLSVIPAVPNLKQLPEFNVDISLDSTFVSKFIGATAALSNQNTFTFECVGGNGSVIVGHSNINTNRISISVDCKCDSDVKPISFSAEFLKEILNSNMDANVAKLKISTQGLAHLHFEFDAYTSDYYLVEIQK